MTWTPRNTNFSSLKKSSTKRSIAIRRKKNLKIKVKHNQKIPGWLQWQNNYYFLTGFFTLFTGFTYFFLAKLPSKAQFSPRREPQPCSSFSVTEAEWKINFNTQGSPSSLYSAVVGDLSRASPFSSPLHSPLFFSKWILNDAAKKVQNPNFYHFIIKPAFRFWKHYLIDLGFLDGYVGFIVCSLAAKGVFMRYVKLYGMRDMGQENNRIE